MKKLVLLASIILTLGMGSTAHAYQAFCVSYDSSGNCSAKTCSAIDAAKEKCSVGPCQSAPTSTACQDAASERKTGSNPAIDMIARAVKILSIIIGFVAVILIVVSGLSMITSAGNTESVTSAKKRLTSAIVGLAIALFAWTLATFVIQHLL